MQSQLHTGIQANKKIFPKMRGRQKGQPKTIEETQFCGLVKKSARSKTMQEVVVTVKKWTVGTDPLVKISIGGKTAKTISFGTLAAACITKSHGDKKSHFVPYLFIDKIVHVERKLLRQVKNFITKNKKASKKYN